MSLVHGYSSSTDASDSGSDGEIERLVPAQEHSIAVTNSPTDKKDASLKRNKSISKRELKRRRKQRSKTGPWGRWDSDSDESAEDLAVTEPLDAKIGYQEVENEEEGCNDIEEISNFYGDTDKRNKSQLLSNVPVDVDTDFRKPALSFKCYLPKKLIYTFSGHENGTTVTEFFPKTGHLFMSGGNDNTVRIWDMYHDRKCLRDYNGHTRAIKALDFDDNGGRFISTSFDQYLKVWDTETGIVTKKLKFRCLPNDVNYRPLNPNEFIVGLSNSTICHYDDRVKAKQGQVQVYDHHQSSILKIKYFLDGSKFVSSSEDKSVRIWENQINAPIKQISDTAQHSMPYINIHPSGHYFCTQSMDNRIYSYGMKPKYKRNPKKIFEGHHSAGFGIGLTFSNDGKYICSGDANGKMFVWDWTTTRLLRSFDLPGKQTILQVAWSPQETSKIICSGTLGKIYLFD